MFYQEFFFFHFCLTKLLILLKIAFKSATLLFNTDCVFIREIIMKIIIGGCGKIGKTILESLANEGHDVVAMDSDPSVIEEISNIYDVMCVCGNCADTEALDEAGVAAAELFVAVSGSDELNMLSCFVAKKMGAKNTIARIRNPEYNDSSLGFLRKHLDLQMSINPELLTARELFNILKLPSAVKIEYFSRRGIEMIELRLRDDSPLDGVKLMELKKKYGVHLLVCVVRRGDKVYIPDGSFVLKNGDKIGITASHSEIQKMLKALGMLQKQAKNVMILGGSTTSFYLAKMLIASGVAVTIIEKSPERCSELSELLPKATIIQGDGAQQELLLEEGLRSVDAFVSLTGMDEENILISIYAAANDVPKVISKVNRAELAIMAENLGLDSIVSPKSVTSDILVRYARALENSMGSNVETLYSVMDGRAEALEFNVKPESRLIDIPIKMLNIKENILLAGIIRGGKTIIPGGDDVILADDRVIVIACNQRLYDLYDIIR